MVLISGEYPPPRATATGIARFLSAVKTNSSRFLQSAKLTFNLPNLSVSKISNSALEKQKFRASKITY